MSQFDDLFWLVEVVEAGTLSAAAEKHQVTSAAVSKRIRLMEERLGVRLLVRTTRRLRTTESGEMYYQRGKRLLEDFQELEENVSSTRDCLSGSMRINAPLSFGLTQLAEPLTKFMQLHPELEINLHLDDRYIDVLNSDYDVVIRIGRLQDSSLVAQRLAQVELYCCASPAYLEQHGYPAQPSDLSKHNCMIYEHGGAMNQWSFFKDRQRYDITVAGRFHCNNGDVMCEMGIRGLGISLQPAFIVQPALATGQLVSLLKDYTIEPIWVYAVYPSRHFLPLKIKRLIDFLRQQLASKFAV
ncbi:LysR family transcriptional regulator [Thiolinea disciformis]|uniref:LysR family transcriptional regulator n=1 Tax=Thiolinea disciformis TaxID=125614 RepID=UPI00036A963D|nr:LysR family transcriptional regulator [Thiolinea disciformis]